jgi:hypothetical protein
MRRSEDRRKSGEGGDPTGGREIPHAFIYARVRRIFSAPALNILAKGYPP